MKRGRVGVGSSIPSADEEERYDANSLSTNKKLEYIVGSNKDNHCDEEEKQVFEESVYVRVCMYVPRGKF